MTLLLFILVMMGSLGPPTAGFNLDPRIPIVKSAGKDGAYFGFSVAQHREVRSSTYGSESNLILVGAPRDDNLQPGTTGSGALYKCRLTPALNVRNPFNYIKTRILRVGKIHALLKNFQ